MLKWTVSGCVVAASAFALAVSLNAGGGEPKAKAKSEKFTPKYADTAFIPTADEVIAKMFEMAKIKRDDVIFDLGAGDNRILYKAALKYGCRGVGVEINPDRVREAMDQYEMYNKGKDFGKLLSLVEYRHGDALKVKDLGDASVVVMYMFPKFMDLWFPIAKEKLKPGTRILSHDYEWTTGWPPVATAYVKSNRGNHKVIMYVVPEAKK